MAETANDSSAEVPSVARRIWSSVESIYKLHIVAEVARLLVSALSALAVVLVSIPIGLTFVPDSIRDGFKAIDYIIVFGYFVMMSISIGAWSKYMTTKTQLRRISRERDNAQIMVSAKAEEAENLSRLIRIYEKYESGFVKYSFINAQNEKELFEKIFPDTTEEFFEESFIEIGDLGRLNNLLEESLRHLLNSASDFLTTLVGVKCHVCVKLILNREQSERKFEYATIKTLMRDSDS